MNNLDAFPIRATSAETVVLTGYFVGNGSSNPSTVVGRGISGVTRDSAGNYTITLTEKFPSLVMPKFTIYGPAGRNVVVTAFDVASAKTISILVSDLATPSATDLTSSYRCYFELSLCNSTVS